MKQIEIWRSQAAESLASLIPKISGNSITAQDALVDDLVRAVNNLPSRPSNRQPYSGIFPAADVATWRSRAAMTLKSSVPKIPDIEGSVFDGAIDDLIRTIRNLPPRPTGRAPYSGLFAAADLNTWRKQAAQSLATLIRNINTPETGDIDDRVDDLLRSMSGLPLRPIIRKPYEGLYNAPNLAAMRQLIAQRMEQLISELKDDLNPKDVLVDGTIRVLNNLPPRPANQEPYLGLYGAAAATANHITQDQLFAIAPYAKANRLTGLLPHLNTAMERYNITSALRKAHFLAQVGHESDGFNTSEEYASGTDYEWRTDLGNNQAGDGVRFKGRGLIQVTGRANYAECGQALGVDLIRNPQRLADDDLACLSAGWFWSTRNLNAPADRDDILTVTRIINGGTNGLEDRQAYLSRAKRVFGI
ncbi:MAG: glycoside hydrolase family 19 protein [Pseudanabaenaceae cyanobacterium bins.39]|nr:glycoside hydrolase family 19 protein [Pseudanabaenaceae cyanobacterium bins.39]